MSHCTNGGFTGSNALRVWAQRSHRPRVIAALGVAACSAGTACGQCPLTFSSAVNYPTGGNGPFYVAAADLNADGRSDLAVVNANSSTIGVLFGNLNGSFQTPVPYPTGLTPIAISAADLNGDGRPDLAAAAVDGAWVHFAAAPPNVGTFLASVNYTNGGGYPSSMAVADLNADSFPDLVLVNQQGGPGSGAEVLLGNPPPNTGTFGPPLHYSAGQNPYSAGVGDFNADGRLDLAIVNSVSNDVSVLLNNGDGTFQQPGLTFAVEANPNAVAVGDFNSDGKLDVATANYSHSDVSVLIGNGNGTFQPKVNYTIGVGARNIAVADFNADGKLDLATSNSLSQSVSILLGNGNGTFLGATNISIGTDASGLAIGDFNGDGRPDIAVPNFSGGAGSTVSILLNTSGPPAATITSGPGANQFVQPGQNAAFTIAADGHGATISYRWRKNGVVMTNGGNISGATSPTLHFTPANATDTGSYDAQVLAPGCNGSTLTTTSQPVVLAVANPCATQLPTVTQQPVAQSASAGGTASYTVAASSPSGAGTPTFHWRRNAVDLADGSFPTGTVVAGSGTPTLILSSIAPADCGAAFDCVVTNGCGTARSDPAGLCVATPCPFDANHDGLINTPDLVQLLAVFGRSCP